MSSIRILIADDHKIIREGLRALVTKEAGMELIAEAENGRKTVRLTQKLRPSVPQIFFALASDVTSSPL